MMARDSSILNPIGFANDWIYFKITSQNSPGAIPKNGMRGFDRETGWDMQKGKGTAGAKLILTNMPPAKGSFALQLWTREHFDEWHLFRTLLKYTPGRKPGSATAADAVDIYYPALAGLDINSVVTDKISPERHMGNGLYIVTIDFIEWRNPPPLSIVATTSQSKVDSNLKKPGDKPNPYGDRPEQLKRALEAFHKTTPG